MLRPVTYINASLTLSVKGKTYDREKMARAVRDVTGTRFKLPTEESVTLELNGVTVSSVIALYKKVERTARSCKSWDNVALDYTATYGGDASTMDLKTLSKQPTPEEDAVTVRKIRSRSNLPAAKLVRGLTLLGYDAAPVKEGRKVVAIRVEGEEYPFSYNTLRDAPWGDFQAEASKALGLPDPNERSGLPPRMRDYRTDLTIRTCPCCFRDIKATDGTMADHGYTLKGHGYSGRVRKGSCSGVGATPWEVSCEPAKGLLAVLRSRSAYLVEALSTTPEKIQVDEGRKGMVTYTSADGYRYKQALRSREFSIKSELRSLWDSSYMSIPWVRMALRTWEPTPATSIAIGAPSHPCIDADFQGQPTF